MKTLLTFVFLLCSILLMANPEPCKCSYPLKTNTCWTTGAKGGQYCINKVGTKTYKPKVKKSIK
jgi:hypothetical protein